MRESEVPTLIPIAEVARRLGRHNTTIWRLIDTDKVEAVRVGRDWFLLESQLPVVEANLRPKKKR